MHLPASIRDLSVGAPTATPSLLGNCQFLVVSGGSVSCAVVVFKGGVVPRPLEVGCCRLSPGVQLLAFLGSWWGF